MIRNIKIYNLVCLIFLCFGCEQAPYAIKYQKQYFDISGIIKYQMSEIYSKKASVTKFMSVKRMCDSVKLHNCSATKELRVFESLNINKPILKDGFYYSGFVTDSSIITHYSRKKATKSKISFLKVTTTLSNKLQSIEAMEQSENPAFASSKQYFMFFDTNNLRLTQYKLIGKQGFVFSDTEEFYVQGNVEWN